METMQQSSFIGRMIGAALLDRDIYEEVEHDRGATAQAAIVIVAGAIAAGIAGLGNAGVTGLVLGIVLGLAGWVVYAWLTYFIGTKILAGSDTSADWGELARTLGFANAPAILLVVGVLSVVSGLVYAIVGIWTLVTTVVAVRAALDIGTGRAIAVAVIGWLSLGIVRSIAGI